MPNFFDIQPPECRLPLPPKEFPDLHPWHQRIFEFDPTPVYKRIAPLLDPYKRYQAVSVMDMFPSLGASVCDCGCGESLVGRQTRWATEACVHFKDRVHAIITGNMPTVQFYILKYYGDVCQDCNNERSRYIEIDHIIGVKHGGGRCWLSNYLPRCKVCHREKTNADFGWARERELLKQQLKLEL